MKTAIAINYVLMAEVESVTARRFCSPQAQVTPPICRDTLSSNFRSSGQSLSAKRELLADRHAGHRSYGSGMLGGGSSSGAGVGPARVTPGHNARMDEVI